MASWYTLILDKKVNKVIKSIIEDEQHPFVITTQDLSDAVGKIWEIKAIPLNSQKVGLSMRRLGYRSFRNSDGLRCWIILD